LQGTEAYAHAKVVAIDEAQFFGDLAEVGRQFSRCFHGESTLPSYINPSNAAVDREGPCALAEGAAVMTGLAVGYSPMPWEECMLRITENHGLCSSSNATTSAGTDS